jgi:hypothetical protein
MAVQETGSLAESGFISGEHYGDEMEVDIAVSAPTTAPAVPVVEQCTDDVTNTTSRGRCNATSYHLALYDRTLFTPHPHLTHHVDCSLSRLSLSEQVSSTMNCLKRYEISDPIGCAVLLSSNGTPDSPGDLTSVCRDVTVITETLAREGWDIISAKSELDSKTLRNLLSTIGKNYLEQQARRLEDYSVFMLYYTGHGTAEGVVLNDGILVPYRDIVTEVGEVQSLSRKPKLFVFDSCRKRKMNPNAQTGYIAPKDLTFHQDLDRYYQEARQLDHSYPPSHTVICFSAAEGKPSFQDQVEGSFYTLALSHAMGQFGRELSFHEIVTQVNGGTQEMTSACGAIQNPIFMSNLEKMLVLNSE